MGSCAGAGSERDGSYGVIPGMPVAMIRRRRDGREGNGQADDAGPAVDGRAADDLSGDLHALGAGEEAGADGGGPPPFPERPGPPPTPRSPAPAPPSSAARSPPP